MTRMEFQNPIYFVLLAGIIPYVVWYVLKHRRLRPSLKVGSTVAFARAPKTWRVWLQHVPFLLNIVIIVTSVCALARPQTSNSWTNKSIEGIDIMLCMDVSTSMPDDEVTLTVKVELLPPPCSECRMRSKSIVRASNSV